MKTRRTRTRRQSVGEEEEEEEETTMRIAFLLQERFKAYREMLSKSSSSKSSSVEDGEGVCGAIDAFVDEDDDDDENAKVFFFDDSFREEFRECCFSATTLTKNQTRTRRRKEEEEEEEEEEEGAAAATTTTTTTTLLKSIFEMRRAFKDICVEQFLREAKAYVLRSPLRELTETLRKIEKEEGEAESLSAVIANALDREEEEEDDDEEDDEEEASSPGFRCLRAFSAFARKVERLKAIASEVAEMVLVGEEEEEKDDDDKDDKNADGKENEKIISAAKGSRSSVKSGNLLPLDAQSQKKKFEKKFDDLIAELIVSCGPRNATRVLSAYYAKVIVKFRNKCAFPLDEEEFYASLEEEKKSGRSRRPATLNTTTSTKTDENNEEESMQLSDDDDNGGDDDDDEENEVQQYRKFVKNVRKHLRNCASPTKMLGKLECAQIERVHKDAILKHFKRYSYEAFEIASDFAIKHFALKFAASNFKASALKCVALYSRVVPLQIAKTVFGFESVQFGNEAPSQFHRKFISSSKEHLGALRIEELFDIVVDHPDSLGAVKDLRMCLSDDRQFGLRESLVSSFNEQLRRRLLHPGARTADVISQYIGTIKTMRDLDPSGIVLDLVSGPIRKYLRKRKDTIRCVVTMLTDDGSGDRNDNNDGDGDGGGGDASTANALFAELGAMAREELKNTNDNADDANPHHHDRRRRKASGGDIVDEDGDESESSELDEDDGASFNQFNEQEFNAFKANENRKKYQEYQMQMRNTFQGVEDYDMDDADEGANNKDGNGSDESESESEGSEDRGLDEFAHFYPAPKKSTSLLKSQNSGMDAIMDYESKQLSRTLTSFGVDQLQNLVLDRTESGMTWGKNFGTPVPVDILSREQSRKMQQQQQQQQQEQQHQEQRHQNLQKAGELESLIPGRKSASAPKKILKRFPGDAWDPEPVVSEATKLRSRKRRQLRDIIGLLVGIYGGKELFVNEYRLMLADKLLQKSNYDAERETLALELLKNKFGETHLHDCEVMLRDVNDSRRVNANVKTRPAEGTPLAKEGIRTTEMLKESPVQALILSKLFWPKDIAKSAATIVAPASTQASLPHPVSAPSIVPSLGQEQEPVQMTMNTNEMYVGEEEEVDGLNDPTSAAAAANTAPTSPPPEGDASVLDDDIDAQLQQQLRDQEEGDEGTPSLLSRSLSTSPPRDPGVSGERENERMKRTTVGARPPSPSAHNDIILPPAIDQAMRAYEERYHELKAPRKMTWMRSLGRVVVEVSLINEKPFEIVVSPLHAAILYHFTEREKWTAEELAKVLNATTKAVRQRMVLWMNRGVVSETSEATYELNTVASSATNNKMMEHRRATGSLKTTIATDGGGGGPGENDDDDDDFLHRAGSSAEEVEAAEMKVYEQYVMGMLTNFPSMPIERIHNMLKMFVVEPAYDKTQAQLEKFLMSLVRAEKLAHDGENFSKRKE